MGKKKAKDICTVDYKSIDRDLDPRLLLYFKSLGLGIGPVTRHPAEEQNGQQDTARGKERASPLFPRYSESFRH
jgi:hypothetical protein